uniref:Aminoacyl-tRNA synthetase class II (D/K/N) domain-containing protein n=1 Tax=Clastoptera arizonana TaxID=38151 RepID=A0A1B6DPV1_9HEMI
MTFALRKSICHLDNHIFLNILRRFSNARIVDILSKKDFDHKMTIKGWIKGLRKMKGNIFIDVDDGSCMKKLQVVIPKEISPKTLSYGSSVEASGQLILNSNKEMELTASTVNVIGNCEVLDSYPFAPRKKYPPEYVRQFLHLRPRTQSFSSLLRLRHAATLAFHTFFNREGFIHINVPVLTANDCEGAGEVFLVTPNNSNLINEMKKENESSEEAFFNGKAFLTVSGQLHLESAVRYRQQS